MITACLDVKVTMLRSVRTMMNTFTTALNDLLRIFDEVEYVLRDGSYERDHPQCAAEWRAMYNTLKDVLSGKSYTDLDSMTGVMGYVCGAVIAINCNDPNYSNQVATALNKLNAFEDFVLAYRTYINTLMSQRNSLCTVIDPLNP